MNTSRRNLLQAAAALPVAAVPSIATTIPVMAAALPSVSPIQAACAEIMRLEAVYAALPESSDDQRLPLPAELTPRAARENPDLMGIDLRSVDTAGSIHAHHVRPLIEAARVSKCEIVQETPEFLDLRSYKTCRETPEARARIARLEALVEAAQNHWKAGPNAAALEVEVHRIGDERIGHEITLIETTSADRADLRAKVTVYMRNPDRYNETPTRAPMSLAKSIMQDVLALFGTA